MYVHLKSNNKVCDIDHWHKVKMPKSKFKWPNGEFGKENLSKQERKIDYGKIACCPK